MSEILSPAHDQAFVPQELVPVRVGSKREVKLYPVVTADMPIAERAHAFQIAKSAVQGLPVDMRTILDVLGAQLNLSTSFEGYRHDWLNYFKGDKWIDMTNCVIESFHDSSGTIINDTTLPGNPFVLKPDGLMCFPHSLR